METDKIISDFALAWRKLDAELIIKHLAPSFKYDSQWVFESLDKTGYADYLHGKFHTLKSRGISVEVKIVDDPSFGGKMLCLIQGGQPVYYRIKVTDGQIVKGDMCMF